jgi:hypothetical protein
MTPFAIAFYAAVPDGNVIILDLRISGISSRAIKSAKYLPLELVAGSPESIELESRMLERLIELISGFGTPLRLGN